MIKLGVEVKEKVTGFRGVITGRATYLYGCDQYCIVPKVQKNKVRSAEWFDEGRLQIIGKGVLPKSVKVKKPGGPNRDRPKDKN